LKDFPRIPDFVSWIDVVSGFRYIDFIRHKSDVFEKFQEFYAMIKNKFG